MKQSGSASDRRKKRLLWPGGVLLALIITAVTACGEADGGSASVPQATTAFAAQITTGTTLAAETTAETTTEATAAATSETTAEVTTEATTRKETATTTKNTTTKKATTKKTTAKKDTTAKRETTAKPTAETTKAASSRLQEIVYGSRTGNHYHTKSCRYANGAEMTIAEAEERGWKPCSFCKP